MTQRTAVGELLEPGREKVLCRHFPTGGRVDGATRNPFTAERIPGKIDRRQADFDDVVGEQLVVDASDDPLALPALRNTKSLVPPPRFDVDQPVSGLLRVATDSLDEANSPRG